MSNIPNVTPEQQRAIAQQVKRFQAAVSAAKRDLHAREIRINRICAEVERDWKRMNEPNREMER